MSVWEQIPTSTIEMDFWRESEIFLQKDYFYLCTFLYNEVLEKQYTTL